MQFALEKERQKGRVEVANINATNRGSNSKKNDPVQNRINFLRNQQTNSQNVPTAKGVANAMRVLNQQSQVEGLDEIINQAANENGVDPLLLRSVIGIESGVKGVNAKSNKGAEGLMQIMPGTARELASQMGLRNYNIYDPRTNVRLGARYLKQQLDAFGSTELALAAYNAGPGAVRRYGKFNTTF